jgi:hypothetical protein
MTRIFGSAGGGISTSERAWEIGGAFRKALWCTTISLAGFARDDFKFGSATWVIKEGS